MLTAIQVNYEAKGILGERENRQDRREYGILDQHVDKAIEFILRRDSDIGFKAAHFSHDDGSNDCIWQEYADEGTRYITWRHDVSMYSHDEPRLVSVREFKRYIKKRMEA